MSYAKKMTKNSAWAMAGFIVYTLANLAISVEVVRYFGPHLYGQYSYFLWLTAVISLIASFGLNQTITKYLPHYFFVKEKVPIGQKLFRKILLVQLGLSIVVNIIVILALGFLMNIVALDENIKTTSLLISAFTILPLSLNTLFTTTLSAIQNFKKLAFIQSISSIINLVAVTFLIINKHNIVDFFWYFLIFNIALCLFYLINLFPLLKKPSPPDFSSEQNAPAEEKLALPTKELISYSFYNYIGTIFGQITWEKSEIFFLGLMSDSRQIGIYALSYGLALMFISAFGPIHNVLSNATAEIIGTNKTDKILDIAQHASKYLAIIMLPAITYTSLFMPDFINFFYGHDFAPIAIFFPLLVLSHALAIIIAPASNVAYFKDGTKKMTLISVITGILNVVLDITLIPKFQALGAVLANIIAQSFSTITVLIHARKYKLGLWNKWMLRVFAINIILAEIFYLGAQVTSNMYWKIFIGIILAISYISMIFRFCFNQKDLQILKSLKKELPPKIQKPVSWLFPGD